MNWIFSLRVILPTVIFVFAASSMWISYHAARDTMIEDAVSRTVLDSRNNLTLLQGSIVQFLNSQNRRSVQQVVASMAAKPDLALFVVVDDADQVIASTRYELIGRTWIDEDLQIDSALVGKVRAQGSTEVVVYGDHDILDGYSALCVGGEGTVLRSERCGFLYYRLSLEYHYRNALISIKQEMMVIGGGLVAGMLLLIFAIDFFVTRRVRKLHRILNEFSDGDRAVRSQCWGRDELRWLGDTVNELLDRVELDETELKYREKKLDTLFEIIIDAIVLIDHRGMMQRVNPATEKMFGYSAGELIGKNVNMLMPEPYHSGHDQYLKSYLTTGNKKIIGIGREVSAKRKDGLVFPIELGVSEMDIGGERVFVGLMRDVSLRKMLENEIIQKNTDLLEANHQLELSALTDGLTGLANRRHFDQALQSAVNLATRKNDPVALLICDVDYFKKYNDHYGHQSGDVCLQKVSSVLAALFKRAGEVAARYGGEEFAVILPEMDELQAAAMAERLVQAIRDIQIEHQASAVSEYVTMSVGYSVYRPTSNMPPALEDFINNADAGLYRAKEQGRNQAAAGRPT